jgi:phenylpropionate dioxygenase-like ring-hydroxylating dioxygenase large terminal subunit
MLIPDRWYAVLDSSEVRKGKPVGARRLAESLVFWRDADGRVVVMNDRCPHRSSQLSLGKVVNGHIQCPFHGFKFDGDGACQLIPANGRAARVPNIFQCQIHPSQEAHGLIWVWYGAPRAQYPGLPWFPDLGGLAYATFAKAWDTDSTRAIEGLLDVSHLPFIHPRTIGRGARTLVNGPYTTLEEDTIRVWVSNQPDEGLPAVKPSQLPSPDRQPSLEFRFPNLWQLRIMDKTRIVNVVAPVEDGHCVIYVRTYVNLSVPPAVGRWIAWVTNLFNRYILSEDYAVIRSQMPKVSGLDIGERFIPADRPIAIYLQRRRDLIEAARAAPSTKASQNGPAPLDSHQWLVAEQQDPDFP